jgi:hypothetical protein
MIKLVIFGVVAFLIGVGGSTGVVVMRTPVKLTAADSLGVHADSTAHGGHPVVTAAAPAAAAHADTSAKPAADAAHPVGPVTAVLAAQSAQISVVKPQENGVHEGRSAEAPDAETYKSVGSILMNMKPVEAAKIVSYMTDEQVEGLLRSMSPRNAATVLAQLPSERAAALSKRLLIPAPKEVHP